MHFRRFHIPLLLLLTIAAACSSSNTVTPKVKPLVGLSIGFPGSGIGSQQCPPPLDQASNCYTPQELRTIYGVQPLTIQGYSGEGQTVLVIVPITSPTLQDDINTFDQEFGLPAITPQVISIVGNLPFDPSNNNMVKSAQEAELDVEMVHAIAPGAAIKVLTSPHATSLVDPIDVLQVEMYAVDHHLGQVLSQSIGFSEAAFLDHQDIAQQFSDFYKQATTVEGVTILAATGDDGAIVPSGGILPSTPTVDFPASDPWVTAVGGTTLERVGLNYVESAWSGSGGGISALFSEPAYQQSLPSNVQTLLNGHRGLPDVAGNADPNTAMACYMLGEWQQCGGTSASTPFWAAVVAIANQVAGHPLGFINPVLYKLGVARQGDFHDITSGNNSVHLDGVSVTGFQATQGWDAVTGWGVPQAYQFIGDLISTSSS